MKNISTCCYYSPFAQHPQHLTLQHNVYLTYAGECLPLHLTEAHKEKALSFHHHVYPSPSHVGFIKNMAVGASKRAGSATPAAGGRSLPEVRLSMRAWAAALRGNCWHGQNAGMAALTITAYFIKAEQVLF